MLLPKLPILYRAHINISLKIFHSSLQPFIYTFIYTNYNQCCGSVTFWYGSAPLTYGSGPCFFLQSAKIHKKKVFSLEKICKFTLLQIQIRSDLNIFFTSTGTVEFSSETKTSRIWIWFGIRTQKRYVFPSKNLSRQYETKKR
jgi:hypothetical protein